MANPICTLKDVAFVFVGLPTPKQTEKELTSPKALTAKIINIRDIQDDYLPKDSSDFSTILVPLGIDIEKFRVQTGDILITARSSLKVAAVQQGHAGALAAANLIVVRPGKILMATLVLAFLRHPETKQKLERLRTGTTVTSIPVKAVASLPIRIPSLEQQTKLAKLAEASERTFIVTMCAAETRRQIAQQVLINSLGPEEV